MTTISRLLGRFGRKQPEDEMKVVREDEHNRIFVVTSEIPMQGRVAQNVPAKLVSAFQRICELNPVIQACLLLDTRERNVENGDVKLLVRLVLNDEAQFDGIADQFIQALKGFPAQTENAYLTFNVDEFDGFMPSAIFRRTDVTRNSA